MQTPYWFKQKFNLTDFAELQQRCEQHDVRISENANSPLINLVYKETAQRDDFFANCCRGIVLNKQDLAVVARPFSRFFNLYENKQNLLLEHALIHTDFTCQVNEKLDGSLIKLYYFDGIWYAGTKSTVFAENYAPNSYVRFFDLFVWALMGKELTEADIQNFTVKKRELGDKHQQDNEHFLQAFAKNCQLDPNATYLFELCSPMNKDVIARPLSVYFLGALLNDQDELDDVENLPNLSQILAQDDSQVAQDLADLLKHQQKTAVSLPNFSHHPSIKLPQIFDLKDTDDMLAMAKSFGVDGEGFVVAINGIPKVKIKSPEFVIKSHQVDTETLSPSRLFNIVFNFEEEEWLANFPDDKSKLMPFVEARQAVLTEAENLYKQAIHQFLQIPLADITVQGDYSQAIKDSATAKKSMAQFIFTNASNKAVGSFALALLTGKSMEQVIAGLTEAHKKSLLLGAVE